MSNVSEQLDLYIEQTLRKVKDYEASILQKRSQLSQLKTQEFLPSMRTENSAANEPNFPNNKAFLLHTISKNVLVFGKFEVPDDFFAVDTSNENEYLINFLVATSKTDATKYQVIFDSFFEISGIRNLTRGNILDTKELYNLVKDIDDTMMENSDEHELSYKRKFIDSLRTYYMGSLTSKRKPKRGEKKSPEQMYF